MSKAIYLTTTIPFVNAPPHVGFALELVQADALARYHRLIGDVVRLQSGTDENAFKNVLSARARGIPVQQLVDENAGRFQALCRQLDISVDRFVRTTEPAHQRAVHAFLARLRQSDLYAAAYKGLYCPGCEDFYLERELVDLCCPEHGTRVVEIDERNHFFRLSSYQDQIRELIISRRLQVIPEARETEVLQFLERGLTDISVSRNAERSGGWGIPWPGDDGQVVYVWIDALINYLTGLDFPDPQFADTWNVGSSKTHLIGKNVWKFHAVYWPALLLSAGLPVPDRIVAHGFLTHGGRKISKSSGDGPAPARYAQALGSDALRYFLLRHVQPFTDTDFSAARLLEVYHADLANGLGNLFSRLTTLCETARVAGLTRADHLEPPSGLHDYVQAFRPDLALAVLWRELACIDREIADYRPWVAIREGRLEPARAHLSDWAARLARIAHWLSPFLPQTAAILRNALAAPLIRKAPPLFPRASGELIGPAGPS